MENIVTDKPYRPCVGVMLVNREGLVFAGKRHPGDRVEHDSVEYEWQMPQGGVDDGEDLYAAALRELREETNVSSVSVSRAAAPPQVGQVVSFQVG